MVKLSTKTVDSKGRLTLGTRFANRTVIVRAIDETEVVITLASVIPEREAWLFMNQKAKGLVAAGLDQAAAGRFSDSPPSLDADAELAARIEGDE